MTTRIEVWHKVVDPRPVTGPKTEYFSWGVYYSWRALLKDVPNLEQFRWAICRVIRPRAIRVILS